MMPGRELIIASLLRSKKPKRCRKDVLELRLTLLSPSIVANDHAGLSPAARADALQLLGRLCLHCTKDCRLAGGRETVPMERRTRAI